MTVKRYEFRNKFKNKLDIYENVFRNRSIKSVIQFNTAKFKYPTDEEIRQLDVTTELWKVGARLYKFADKYYGDPELWWIIAWYNKKPTEGHFEIGDLVYIPLRLESVFKYFNNE